MIGSGSNLRTGHELIHLIQNFVGGLGIDGPVSFGGAADTALGAQTGSEQPIKSLAGPTREPPVLLT